MLTTIDIKKWDESINAKAAQLTINHLEQGQIIYLSELAFKLFADEEQFLTPHYAHPQAKNISYHILHQQLKGTQYLTTAQQQQLTAMLHRFAEQAKLLICHLFPIYAPHLIWGRTSFRPVQISNRKTSYRKDDKRLHVDAFPATPNQGKRILRVFSNINPVNQQRIWRVGEPFEDVAKQFLPRIKAPWLGIRTLLKLFKMTKSYRTLYDHFMLQIHDRMKEDELYQVNAKQREVQFPANTSWIVQTDHVSHAAMQGQYALEQTFYLPVQAMLNPDQSPLHTLERLLKCRLI